MALSKRAQAAMDVLRSEADGNPQAASALASFSRALGGAESGKSEQDSPGKQSAKRALAESQSSASPRKSSGGNVPPQFAEKSSASKSKSKPNNGATAPNSFIEQMKRRRGSARKGK